jgi:hypothetical protein
VGQFCFCLGNDDSVLALHSHEDFSLQAVAAASCVYASQVADLNLADCPVLRS